jgi:hypothetical protein
MDLARLRQFLIQLPLIAMPAKLIHCGLSYCLPLIVG